MALESHAEYLAEQAEFGDFEVRTRNFGKCTTKAERIENKKSGFDHTRRLVDNWRNNEMNNQRIIKFWRWYNSSKTNVLICSPYGGLPTLKFPKFSNGIQQHFSLPKTYICYISKYVSNPKTDKKLLKSCKWFLENNRYILFHCFNGIIYERSEFSTCEKFVDKINDTQYCYCKGGSIEINMDSMPYKILVKNSFFFNSENSSNELSLLLPHLKCIAFHVYLRNVNLSIKEFSLINSSTTFCEVDNLKITASNGEYLSIVQIIQVLPNVQHFGFRFFSNFTPTMLQQIAALSKLTTLSINKVPETFEIESFFNIFIKKIKTLQLIIDFETVKMSINYQRRIEAIYDQILNDNGKTYFPPVIWAFDLISPIKHKMAQVRDIHFRLVNDQQTHINRDQI